MPALINIHTGKRFPEHFTLSAVPVPAYHGRNLSCPSERRTDKTGFTKEEMETLDDFFLYCPLPVHGPIDETNSIFCLNDRLKELAQYEK